MRVLKQPDGKYAVWSSVVDDFIVWDATADDIDTYVVQEAIKKAQEDAMKMIAQAEITNPDTFLEKIEFRETFHGPVNMKNPEEQEFGTWVKKWRENTE